MKSNFLTIHYITFADIFFDDVFKKNHIYNNIKKFVENLLI